MRIAYLCHWNAFARDGVARKIASQIEAWRRLGHESRSFWLTPADDEGRSVPIAGELFPFNTAADRVRSTRRAVRAIYDYAPDVVYLRYDVFLPSLGRLLRAFPSAVEINTDDRAEFAHRRRTARVYNLYNRRVTLGAADGLVAVSRQLAQTQNVAGKPTVVVANGVELPDLPGRPPRRTGRPPELVFLGGRPSRWHGLDKVVALARTVPAWRFHLVGVSRAQLHSVPDNVELYERMPRHEYARLLLSADAGIGTLALHRIRVTEASPLKLREYLAHGLPSVIAYEDTDFAGSSPWFLHQLPNTENNVCEGVEGLRSFVEGLDGRRVARHDVDHLSWEAKERIRLAFFDELIARRGGVARGTGADDSDTP